MKKFIILVITFLLLPTVVNARSDSIKVTLDSCVDGDTATFNYNDEKIKARFLAIDTPETKHPKKGEQPYGKEASNYTCEQLKSAKNIVLEFDEGSDEKDKYDRYLVWVFVDGDLLQTKLVEKGLAKVAYLYGDYKYTEELQDKENIAKEEHIGIWEDEKNKDKNSLEDYIFLILVAIFIIVAIITVIKKKSK